VLECDCHVRFKVLLNEGEQTFMAFVGERAPVRISAAMRAFIVRLRTHEHNLSVVMPSPIPWYGSLPRNQR
jgi:hypothetical protein